MAASKDTRASGCEPNPFFLELFRNLADFGERERTWHTAMAHAGEGMPALRFPVYETLYLINVYSQRLVDLLAEVSSRFGIDHESVEYHQTLIQFVRAAASQSVAVHMNDLEITEEWLFEQQRTSEEEKRRDPDDVYISVRRREAERADQGLPPRIQFLDESLPVKAPTAKERGADEAE